MRLASIRSLPSAMMCGVAMKGAAVSSRFARASRAVVFGTLAYAAMPTFAMAQTAAPQNDAIEIEYWHSIQNSTDPADFEAYLKKFSNGNFVELARNRLAKLHAPADICQSLIGTWSWFVNGDVEFRTDGTARQAFSGFDATWTCDKGTVTIKWPMGIVDKLTLSADGKHLKGRGGFLGLSTVTGDRQ